MPDEFLTGEFYTRDQLSKGVDMIIDEFVDNLDLPVEDDLDILYNLA